MAVAICKDQVCYPSLEQKAHSATDYRQSLTLPVTAFHRSRFEAPACSDLRLWGKESLHPHHTLLAIHSTTPAPLTPLTLLVKAQVLPVTDRHQSPLEAPACSVLLFRETEALSLHHAHLTTPPTAHAPLTAQVLPQATIPRDLS